jgi:hypothetical protein
MEDFWVFACRCGRLSVEMLGSMIHDSILVNGFIWVFTPDPGGPSMILDDHGPSWTRPGSPSTRIPIDPSAVTEVVDSAVRIAKISYVMSS